MTLAFWITLVVLPLAFGAPLFWRFYTQPPVLHEMTVEEYRTMMNRALPKLMARAPLWVKASPAVSEAYIREATRLSGAPVTPLLNLGAGGAGGSGIVKTVVKEVAAVSENHWRKFIRKGEQFPTAPIQTTEFMLFEESKLRPAERRRRERARDPKRYPNG